MSKFYFYLTDEERSLIIESLISKKNSLISEGKYTDGIDDVLFKILRSKKKKVKIITPQSNSKGTTDGRKIR